MEVPEGQDWIALFDDRLPVEDAMAWATRPGCGAVIVFTGVVRDHSEGRPGVSSLTYEAYESQAVVRMEQIATEARKRWPDIDRVALLHRLGRLELTDASVAVVVGSPHRPDAFEAGRYCIDTLKETVPIWKAEEWESGTDWSAADHPLRPV